MFAILQGIRALDFTANDGGHVIGTQLFISFDETGVVGKATDKVFVKQGVELPAKLQPGAKLDIAFDRKVKVEGVYTAE